MKISTLTIRLDKDLDALLSRDLCPTDQPDVLRRPQTPAGRGVWGETKVMPTRPGVEQRVLIVRPDGKAKGSVLLFRGGDGSQPFSEVSDGFILDGNFLTRSSNSYHPSTCCH